MTTEKKIRLVFGKRGSGKSVLTKHLIQKVNRLVVFDIMSEYVEGVTFDDTNREQLAEFWRHVYRKDFRIIYRPLKSKDEIQWLAEAVFALGDLTFVVEEIDAICTPFDMPYSMQSIIQRGRHKNIEMIGVTPAPFGIHRDLTRQAKDIFIFKTGEPRDIQYLRQLLGVRIEEKLAALEQFEFVHWSDAHADFRIGKVENGKAIKYKNHSEAARTARRQEL